MTSPSRVISYSLRSLLCWLPRNFTMAYQTLELPVELNSIADDPPGQEGRAVRAEPQSMYESLTSIVITRVTPMENDSVPF